MSAILLSECESISTLYPFLDFYLLGSEEKLHLLIPPNIPGPVLSLTQALLAPASLPPPPPTPSPVKWVTPPSNSWSIDTPILTVHLPQSSGLPQQISWHRKGDYLATVCKCCIARFFLIRCTQCSSIASSGTQSGVWIHQITRRHSQAPFKKIRGAVQLVLFHPLKPHFFVAVSIVLLILLMYKHRSPSN